jgi:hypothetical protein
VVVSVDGRDGGDCETPFVQNSYGCPEQGAGTYTVTVTVRGQSKSKSAVIHANDCHTTDSAQLDFAFDVVADVDASVGSTVPTDASSSENDVLDDSSSETDTLQDAAIGEESRAVMCDGKTCGENQYCVHSCRCGFARPPFDSGVDDSGVDPCAPPAPYCADALPLRPGPNDFSPACSMMCGGPWFCELFTPGNLRCICG